MKRKILLILVTLLVISGSGNSYTLKGFTIKTATYGINEAGVYELSTSSLVGGSSTDCIIIATKANTTLTLNNSKVAISTDSASSTKVLNFSAGSSTSRIIDTEEELFSGRVTRDSGTSYTVILDLPNADADWALLYGLEWYSPRTGGNASGSNIYNYSYNNYLSISRVDTNKLTANTRNGAYSASGGSGNTVRYTYTCAAENTSISSTSQIGIKGAISKAPVYSSGRTQAFNLTLSWDNPTKSCVYGSCTLVNSTVEGAPLHYQEGGTMI